jgi:UDP-GlcNAc:undecaprenyl-phosphate GlcNAc-1-phosphate transferase
LQTLVNIAAITSGFVLALILTPVVRTLARQWKLVAQPKQDRWHQRPTAMFGGVAMFLSMTLAVGFTSAFRSIAPVLGGASFLFLVGFIDDLRQCKPYQKLITQLMAAALVVFCGILLPWTPWPLANMALTVLWLVGITNAVNLLDNMDGLAAGISAIAATFLGITFLQNGQLGEAVATGTFVAVLLGFLIFNTHPASIFMGDCGSMFIGFFLAGTALLSVSGGRTQGVLSVLAVPVLTLLIPIFDTTLVTLLRKLSGRAISQGGRDHTSHRLVGLGMSERRAVAMLYGLAAIVGLLGLTVRALPLDAALAVTAVAVIGLAFLGVHLARVKVYDQTPTSSDAKELPFAFLLQISYKRRLFEVLLDVVLIVLSYYTAYALLFGSVAENRAWHQFLQILPILIGVKLPILMAMGVYRGIWRYIGVHDVKVYVKAVALSTAVGAFVVLLISRFQGFSRAVFLLDGMILFMLLMSSRLVFRSLSAVLSARREAEPGLRRVLIYGADDAGELLLHQLRGTPEWQLDPIGFVDDDHHKEGKVIHGLRVFGGNGSLGSLVQKHGIEEIIIAQEFSPVRLDEIREECSRQKITLRRMRVDLEVLLLR